MPFCLKNNHHNPHRQHHCALLGKILIDHLQDAFDQSTNKLNNKDFTNRLTQYQCKSKDSWGLDYYKQDIMKTLKDYKKRIPTSKINSCNKRLVTSLIYYQKVTKSSKCFFKIIFFQNRLIRLNISVGVGVKNDIHYRRKSTLSSSWIYSWSRGRKCIL